VSLWHIQCRYKSNDDNDNTNDYNSDYDDDDDDDDDDDRMKVWVIENDADDKCERTMR
jgi:hypothetical protein